MFGWNWRWNNCRPVLLLKYTYFCVTAGGLREIIFIVRTAWEWDTELPVGAELAAPAFDLGRIQLSGRAEEEA